MAGFSLKTRRKAAKAKRDKRVKKTARGGVAFGMVLPRVLAAALLLAACVIPVVFVASPVTYIPLVAIVLVVAMSFAYLQVLKRSFAYSEDSMVDSCERGSEIEFVVTFVNKSILPFVRLEPYYYISDLFGDVSDDIPASTVLMPRERFEFKFAAVFDHLGTYSAGVSRIVIGDFLGLFQHTIINPNKHEVRVLPRVFDIADLDLANVSVQESRKAFQPIVTDDMDYAGVREYVPGDPLKTIHWKLSSRNPEGVYFTRLFETFGNPGIDIVIDHSSPRYDSESLMQVFDGLIESAVSIGIAAREMGIDATLMYKDKYGQTRRAKAYTRDNASDLISDIPRVSVGEGDDALELLRRSVQSVHGEGNVAFCTAHVDERLVSLLQDAKLRKRNPLLFLVVPTSLEGQERREFLRPVRRLQSAQVSVYVISNAQQIEGMGV